VLDFDYSNEINRIKKLVAECYAISGGSFRIEGPSGAGKTYLVSQYIKSHSRNCLYYSCKEAHTRMAKKVFLDMFYPGDEAPENWNEVFEKVKSSGNGKLQILFIDDYSYCNDSDFINGIRQLLSRSKLVIIFICEEYKPNRYGGKQTGTVFRTIWHFKKALPNYSNQDISRLFAITGGNISAAKDLDPDIDYEENLRRLISYDSSLVRCFPEYMKRNFRSPEAYYPILYAIARGKSHIAEISKETGYPNNKCDTYIKALINIGVVYKKSVDDKKISTYHISNSYYRFWILYIYRNTDKLVSSPEKLLKHISDTVDKRIVLPAVTEACIRYMMEFNYPNRSGMDYEIGFQVSNYGLNIKPVKYTFKDNKYSVSFDCKIDCDGTRVIVIFPHDMDKRYTKNDILRIYHIMRSQGPLYNQMLMIFSFNRFSDWCVHESGETSNLFFIPVDRLKY
jgi:AAA+ ATPase superfamily predicted ATPase